MCFRSRNLWTASLALTLLFAWSEDAVAETASPLISWHAGQEKPTPQPPAQSAPPVRYDSQVAPAAVAEPVAPAKPADPRRLAPPSQAVEFPPRKSFSASDSLPFDIPHADSLTTAGAGLAIVLGLFLLCAWLVRRSGPKPTTPLPRDAVAVLGRTPLAGNHFAHLIQLGNKLVLVSIGPDGARPLAEVSEPLEVHRLLGLCLRNHKQSSTAEFHNVLEQLAREGGRGFLGDQAASAYTRGGRT